MGSTQSEVREKGIARSEMRMSWETELPTQPGEGLVWQPT